MIVFFHFPFAVQRLTFLPEKCVCIYLYIFTGPPALYPVSTPVSSSWTRIRDTANVIVLLTGAAYAVYHLYKVSMLHLPVSRLR